MTKEDDFVHKLCEERIESAATITALKKVVARQKKSMAVLKKQNLKLAQRNADLEHPARRSKR